MHQSSQSVVPSRLAPRRLDRSVLAVAVVLVALFASSAALFWRVGVFDAGTTASNAQILAAVLGLVGVLVTASLTFVGVLLKHSLDTRTLQHTLETEGRLRLETSIRAVELLTEDGKPATPTRQAGALFVLVNLNQLDFAFALLDQIWAQREVSPGAAVWVINRLLLDGDAPLQRQAAILLDSNADALLTPGDYEFPDCVTLRWRSDFEKGAREYLLAAFVRIMLARSRHEWEDDVLNSFVLQLDVVRRVEEEPYIQNGAVVCLDALLEAYPFEPGSAIYAPDGRIDVDEIVEAVRRLLPEVGADVVASHAYLADRLRTDWAQAPAEPEPEPAPSLQLEA